MKNRHPMLQLAGDLWRRSGSQTLYSGAGTEAVRRGPFRNGWLQVIVPSFSVYAFPSSLARKVILWNAREDSLGRRPIGWRAFCSCGQAHG